MIARQVGGGLLTLFVISIVTFGLMSVRTPDQIARARFGNQVTPAQVQAFAQEYGLEKPVYQRYGTWLWHFVQGDMGTSYVTTTSVASNVIPRFKRTIILSLVSLLVALPLSVLVGVFQARRMGSPADLALLGFSVVVAALPEFVVGIALLYVFGIRLGWLPVDSSSALVFASSFSATAKAYVLPAATLVLAMVPYIARIARGSVREALGMPYTQAAVLRGLRRGTVVWDHAFRNAAVPLVNAVSINIVYLLSSVIAVEWVFGFPGLGQGLVQATQTSDAFNVEAIALLSGAVFIAVSILADIAVAYLNPRLKAASLE
ncbi:MAG TPA: ABC transporter permease [Gaiellaceae bacterium]|nr:ABC transporter permease [Gaiellaceae bacterium]